jgi:hypothetical protein
LEETINALGKLETRLRDAANDVVLLVGVTKRLHEKVVTLNRLLNEERQMRMAKKVKLRPGLMRRKEVSG